MIPGSFVDDRPFWQRTLIGFCVLLIIALIPIILSCSLHPVPAPGQATAPVHVKILAVNDFHGQLPAGQKLNREAAGSAPVLASYLKAAMNESPTDATFIALPGDVVGASPPESGLMLDEPTMLFFNEFANGCCGKDSACSASCNMVATLGNHEFDKGTTELMRKINGGDGTTTITHLVDPYPGEKAGYVSANVVWQTNGTTLFAPYVIRNAGGTKIAFIGADTTKIPSITIPANIAGVTFLNETESINRYVPEIQQQGVHAIVVLLHEGGNQDAYVGPTRAGGNVTGSVTGIVAGLDPDVDVVLSGHTHAFTNAYLNNSGNKPVLVTQAYSYSRAFADIDLTIDPATDEITQKSANIVSAYADRPPGTTPDPATAALLAADEQAVTPLTGRVIAVAAADITRDQTDAGESALGDLVADAQRAAMHADVAFITTGTLRADIAKGNITWGDLYAVQPFSGTVFAMNLTGEQVRNVLEQQWQSPLPPYNLAVSGLMYTFDAGKPAGHRITDIRVNGVPLDTGATYRAALMDYLATGGDGYTVFTRGTGTVPGPSDVDTLVSYVGSLPQPVNGTTEGRITRTA
ncbi:MAG TPA: bifunctional metallophosphatase/5'-nucleotidase [Methanoregula sp.]|nr:bifunctional metallophosphatase/5'-nucleotidase [Methanoregula sp.]